MWQTTQNFTGVNYVNYADLLFHFPMNNRLKLCKNEPGRKRDTQR